MTKRQAAAGDRQTCGCFLEQAFPPVNCRAERSKVKGAIARGLIYRHGKATNPSRLRAPNGRDLHVFTCHPAQTCWHTEPGNQAGQLVVGS